MATKSFNDSIKINKSSMEKLLAVSEKESQLNSVQPITSDEIERRKKAAKEWMSHR